MAGWFDIIRKILGWPSRRRVGQKLSWHGHTNRELVWGVAMEENPTLKTVAWAGGTSQTIAWGEATEENPPLINVAWQGQSNQTLSWGHPREDNPPLLSIQWSGRTNLNITWDGPAGSTNMKQHRFPVREATPQELEYTFRDADNAVIDLTPYDSVYLLVKLQGSAFDEDEWMVEAEFVSKPDGEVRYVGFAFGDGEWTAQFKCQIGTSNPLYGEPVRFKVVKNVDTLGANELPEF